jgi:hypothetical protein
MSQSPLPGNVPGNLVSFDIALITSLNFTMLMSITYYPICQAK